MLSLDITRERSVGLVLVDIAKPLQEPYALMCTQLLSDPL